MTTEVIGLPTDIPAFTGIRIAYLCKRIKDGDCGGFSYLQGIRRTLKLICDDPENSFAAQGYRVNLPSYVKRLTQLLVSSVDAVVSPPSRYPEQAAPYREAAKAKFSIALDLTDAFSRSKLVLASEGAELSEIIQGLCYVSNGVESAISSLLIVEDVFSRGRTSAALLVHLRSAGLPPSCEVQVACPLWIPQ